METIHPLVYIGLLLLLSYAGGKVANYFKAPRVTGYLVIGMLLSPSLLGLFHERLIKEDLVIVTDIALSIIAFSIGGSLSLIKLKKLGKHIFWITFTQSFGAFIFTTLMLSLFFYFIHSLGAIQSSFWTLYFPMAFVIGAISAATAPAAIMAIVHEYKAKGPFTTILLGVIALDDALTILFAAFAFSMARIFVNQEAVSFTNLFLSPIFSILLSLVIGGVLGICLRKLICFVLRKEAILSVIVGAILLAGGLAISLKASHLLANMMLGFVVVNFVRHHEDLFVVVESIEEPIFGMFFTLAGAHMDLKVMQTAGLIALVIVLGRFSGKLLGSRFGAQISGAPEAVKKYLGLALLPKAGVTVGLVLVAGEVFGDTYLSEIMVNAVLGSIIINELMAPFLVRFSLRRAGEA
jgi:Kef-type K+ transport system membrane component KefB